MEAATKRRRNQLTIVLTIAALFMFSFTYGLKKMYEGMTHALSINGKTGVQVIASEHVDVSREVDVQFIATAYGNIPMRFNAPPEAMRIHPGQNVVVNYMAENDGRTPTVVRGVLSISPGLAAKYFKKVECFCETTQVVGAHQHIELPMKFYVSEDLPMNIHTITASYTLFDATKFAQKS